MKGIMLLVSLLVGLSFTKSFCKSTNSPKIVQTIEAQYIVARYKKKRITKRKSKKKAAKKSSVSKIQELRKKKEYQRLKPIEYYDIEFKTKTREEKESQIITLRQKFQKELLQKAIESRDFLKIISDSSS